MTRINELKDIFSAGRRPTQEHFELLLDTITRSSLDVVIFADVSDAENLFIPTITDANYVAESISPEALVQFTRQMIFGSTSPPQGSDIEDFSLRAIKEEVRYFNVPLIIDKSHITHNTVLDTAVQDIDSISAFRSWRRELFRFET